jgi:uncharacterized RDD family membrane protein YckC
MSGWYYLVDGSVKGPVSHNTMSEMIRFGQIAPDTLVWAKFIDRWTLVKSIEPYKDMFPDKLSTGTESKRRIIRNAKLPDATEDKNDGSHYNTGSDYTYRPRPWVRYWARFFDYAIFGIIMDILAGAVVFTLNPTYVYSGTDGTILHVLYLGLWVFVEAYLLSTWGTTIGKWLLGVSVKDYKGDKLTYKAALNRSLQVWVKGMILGLPFITLFGLIRSYNQLGGKWEKTSWDLHGGYVVRHKKLNFFGVFTVVIVLSGLALLNYF